MANRRAGLRPKPNSSAVNVYRLQSVVGNLSRALRIASSTACSGVQRRHVATAARVPSCPAAYQFARSREDIGRRLGQQNFSSTAVSAATSNGFGSNATTPGAFCAA